MATVNVAISRISAQKIFNPSQSRVTPPVSYINKQKTFTAPTNGGGPGPTTRRKTQTIDIRM